MRLSWLLAWIGIIGIVVAVADRFGVSRPSEAGVSDRGVEASPSPTGAGQHPTVMRIPHVRVV